MTQLIKQKNKSAKPSLISDCLNCGQPLSTADKFCSYCGQKNIQKLSFSSFIDQIISGFFSYDSRFWKTFIPLLIKPGILSKNFIEGKRARYVNPFQMYLHVSIIFFIIIGWNNNTTSEENVQRNEINQIDIDSLITSTKGVLLKPVVIDSTNNKISTDLGSGITFSEKFNDTIYNIDQGIYSTLTVSDKIEDFYSFNTNNPTIVNTNQALNRLGYPTTFWNTFYFEHALKIRKNTIKIQQDSGKGFLKSLMSYMSIGLFIFLPLFTLVLKLFYYRKHMNYMEHLVFVFHTQTVFFLLLIISNIISLFSDYENAWIFTLLFLIYLYLAIRTFYNQGRFKTLLKFTLLNIIYGGLGAIGFLVISLIAFVFD